MLYFLKEDRKFLYLFEDEWRYLIMHFLCYLLLCFFLRSVTDKLSLFPFPFFPKSIQSLIQLSDNGRSSINRLIPSSIYRASFPKIILFRYCALILPSYWQLHVVLFHLQLTIDQKESFLVRF